MEVNVEDPKDLMVAASGKGSSGIPLLTVASLNLKTVINHKHNVNEIASISVVYCKRVKVDAPIPLAEWNNRDGLNHFSIVRKLDGGMFPVGFVSEVAKINSNSTNTLNAESSERALLNLLMVKLHQLDADVLVGHHISGFDLDILLHRLQANKVASSMWSKIGRLKRSLMPRLNGGGSTFGSGASPGVLTCLAGRLLCDTYLSSQELLREVSYSLTQLAKSQLGRDRKELAPSQIPGMYGNSSSLLELIESGETDAWLSLGLMFHLNVLPLTRQLTNISGNLWSKTLQVWAFCRTQI
jgi:DNA polymerase alpha subunit A